MAKNKMFVPYLKYSEEIRGKECSTTQLSEREFNSWWNSISEAEKTFWKTRFESGSARILEKEAAGYQLVLTNDANVSKAA